MVKDLKLGCKTVKFVDDTTVYFSRDKNSSDTDPMQDIMNQVQDWSNKNDMRLNAKKTKLMISSFGETPPCLRPVRINNSPIEYVDEAKVLGIHINNMLTWDDHCEAIIKKANSRLYILVGLIRAGAKMEHKVLSYTTYIRPILEYGAPCWSPGLNKDQIESIKSVQDRCIKLIVPGKGVTEGRVMLKLDTLETRRDKLCKDFFYKCTKECHKLSHLVPPMRDLVYNLRPGTTREREPPKINTKRAQQSIIVHGLMNYQLNKK